MGHGITTTLPAPMFLPSEDGRQQASENWLYAKQNDPYAVSMYLRHYSRKNNSSIDNMLVSGCAGPGETISLLSAKGDAVFTWKLEVFRQDGQTGINCAIFRNEGELLSSLLIIEACSIAWQRWPGARLFTFVNADKVRRKRDPGRCFIRAGWKQCGISKGGLLIFEIFPKEGES